MEKTNMAGQSHKELPTNEIKQNSNKLQNIKLYICLASNLVLLLFDIYYGHDSRVIEAIIVILSVDSAADYYIKYRSDKNKKDIWNACLQLILALVWMFLYIKSTIR